MCVASAPLQRAKGSVIVATGQLGLQARIHVWDADKLDTLAVLR
jgi:hypothetical protein